MSIYPDLETLLEEAGEITDKHHPLLQVHRTLRSVIPSMIYCFLSVVAVIVFNIYFQDHNLLGFLPFIKIHVSQRWLGIIPALLFVEIIRKYHDDLYTLYLHSLSHQDGRLSLTYKVPNIRYVDIRAVTVNQGLTGRIFDFGDIELDTAAQEKGEMSLNAVRSPYALAELIESFRQNSMKNFSDGSEERNHQIGGD